MAIYLVSGKLGAGKTLVSVSRIQAALLEGRRVATNLDLTLERLLPVRAGERRAVAVLRLPDKPSVADLEALGSGNDSRDETQNGLIVLDELAAWLNARSWADKERQAVIDWLIHSRKRGWDVVFIAQHLDQIDKQVRTALVEYLVVCRRLDRMQIPLVGNAIRMLSGGWLSGRMPRVHVATVRYGVSPDAPVSDRWIYRGHELFDAYDTRQVFTDRYAHGVFSYLPPWHTVGRYLSWWSMYKRKVIGGVVVAFLGGGAVGAGAMKVSSSAPPVVAAVAVEKAVTVRGVVRSQAGAPVVVMLSDGTSGKVEAFRRDGARWVYRVGGKWFGDSQ